MSISNFPSTSRLWIYQADRPFDSTELDFINDKLNHFIGEWNNHGNNLTAGFEIKYKHFILLVVDESQMNASGCSIDSSVRIIKEIGSELNVDFFDRLKVAKFEEDVTILKMNDINAGIQDGSFTKETKVFNNLIDTLSQLDSEWIVPAEQTWLKRSF